MQGQRRGWTPAGGFGSRRLLPAVRPAGSSARADPALSREFRGDFRVAGCPCRRRSVPHHCLSVGLTTWCFFMVMAERGRTKGEIEKPFPEPFHGPGWWSRLEAVADKTRRSFPGSGLPYPLSGAGGGNAPPRAGETSVGSPIPSPGSLPLSIAGAPEQGEQLPPSKRLPSGRRAADSGGWPLGPMRGRQLPALQLWPPSAARGSRGQQQERLAAGAEATVPRHVEEREEPAFPPGTAFFGMGREPAEARLGCLAPQLLPCAGESVGERLREQEKTDLKVQEVRKQWLSLPRQPVLPRRWKTPNLGGKLQYSKH
ncbi:uncharacterized protein LOC107206843 [Parus major]|uniref:uncharacterized protein LOC107206843 n=1 Tax=Parus major TaxID=9157 RepID=UPI0014446A2E|nr:uncharacterized protein LOC107206843 [Parus major]